MLRCVIHNRPFGTQKFKRPLADLLEYVRVSFELVLKPATEIRRSMATRGQHYSKRAKGTKRMYRSTFGL